MKKGKEEVEGEEGRGITEVKRYIRIRNKVNKKISREREREKEKERERGRVGEKEEEHKKEGKKNEGKKNKGEEN